LVRVIPGHPVRQPRPVRRHDTDRDPRRHLRQRPPVCPGVNFMTKTFSDQFLSLHSGQYFIQKQQSSPGVVI
jgi:hypothetical protein